MFERSVIEVSKRLVRKNLTFIRSLLSPETTLCAVVKGNAYGHGLDVYPAMAQAEGVSCFAVSSAEEAYMLYRYLPQTGSRIIVMTPPPTEALEWLIDRKIEFYVDLPKRLPPIQQVSKMIKKPARIHLELETGMYRTGVLPNDLVKCVTQIGSNPEYFTICGVCTHLAGSERYSNAERVNAQVQLFHKLAKKVNAKTKSNVAKHIACSAALIACPGENLDLARVGVMQYGLWPASEIRGRYMAENNLKRDPLRQVLTWKTNVSSIQLIPEGVYVGYGESYKASRDMKIAIVPIGYSDGLPRSLSNLGHLLIKGKRAPIVGMVNMNMCSIDITEIKGVKLGDEVVVIGSQGKERTIVTSFSDLASSMNYESLVRLSERIPRVVVD